MQNRRFVIPDIHGCAITFHKLLHEKLKISKADTVYLLGDLVDRGPRSRAVLDLILDLRSQGFSINALRGNHEQMLLNAIQSESDVDTWLINGGKASLDSFGIRRPEDLNPRYRTLLDSLPFYIVLDDFILVHAGMNFERYAPFTDTWAMLWTRSDRVDSSQIGNRRLICGHTPHGIPTIRASLRKRMILLDNGCVYVNKSGLGNLTALELNSMELSFQENIDMQAK